MAVSLHYLCCFSFLLFGRLIVCRTHFTSKDVSQDLCHSVLMCSNLKKKSFQLFRIWNLNAPYVFAICVLHFIWKTTLIDIQSYQKIVAHFYTLGSMVTHKNRFYKLFVFLVWLFSSVSVTGLYWLLSICQCVFHLYIFISV